MKKLERLLSDFEFENVSATVDTIDWKACKKIKV